MCTQKGPTRRLIKKPMVCSISGFCIANGLELALMCDLRVIEDDAILGFFNRRFGIPLMDGGTVRLPAMIGLSRALDLVLTGKYVFAKEAFEIGIANRIVAPGTGEWSNSNVVSVIRSIDTSSILRYTIVLQTLNRILNRLPLYRSRTSD